jgi:Pyruvate/2-oxoacid:ferredoxin oxidoreductase delta subunit
VGVTAPVRVTEACAGCGACLLTCPERAIRPGDVQPLVVVPHLCTGCLECVEVCPVDAIDTVAIHTIGAEEVSA